MRTSLKLAAVGIASLCGLASACSGTDNSGGTVGPGGQTGTGSTGGGGSGGNGAVIGVGGGIIIDGGGAVGGSLEGGACAKETQTASLVPLDLYLMLDRSASMLNQNGWASVKQALGAFVVDKASEGLGVGLGFFPGSPECVTKTYSTPAVPIALLPGNALPVSTALGATTPGGQTPTMPALDGAMERMTLWLLNNPTHTGIVVLATDGIPNNCASTVDKVAAIAAKYANDTPKIQTFVIGVGSNLTDLDKIAQAGGSTKAFLVDTTGNVTQQFIDAMNAIRGGSISCEYLIPTPKEGTLDPNKVNVEYVPSGGGPPELFPRVDNEAACPATGDGWYYDNPVTPTKVVLCPSSCTKTKGDSGAKVSVTFGCVSVVR